MPDAARRQSRWRLGNPILVLGCAPVAIFLAVLHGGSPQTIAQILYDADQSAVGIVRTRLHEMHPTVIDLI